MVTIARMYDFESVSVSSFEAASLAATLTEKSADGWDVVAIVTAGSTSSPTSAAPASSATPLSADADAVDRRRPPTREAAESTSDSVAAAELLTPTSVSSEPSVLDRDTSTTSSTSSADTGRHRLGRRQRHDGGSGGRRRLGRHLGVLVLERLGAADDRRRSRRPRSRPGGTPTRRVASSCATGTARRGPSTCSRGGQQYTDPPVA